MPSPAIEHHPLSFVLFCDPPLLMAILRKILHYANPLNLFRKSEGEGVNLRVMHSINKVSMTLFLLCLIYLMIRTLTR